jgi:hypothetical protein
LGRAFVESATDPSVAFGDSSPQGGERLRLGVAFHDLESRISIRYFINNRSLTVAVSSPLSSCSRLPLARQR